MANLKQLKLGSTVYDLGITNLASSSVDGLMSKEDKAKFDLDAKNFENLTLKNVTAESGYAATYQLGYEVAATEEGADATWTKLGASINIPKDQFLKKAELVKIELNAAGEDVTKEGVTDTTVASTKSVLRFTFNVEDGTSIADIDFQEIFAEAKYGNGLEVSSTGVVSVKIDTASETFLTVGASGIKLSGVQTAIDTAKSDAISDSEGYTDGLLGTGFSAESGKTVADKISSIETSLTTGDVATKISNIEDQIGDKASTISGDAYNALSDTEKTGYTKNEDGTYTKAATGLEKEIADNAASIAALTTVVDNNKSTIDAYTVNGKKISENPVLATGDINVTDNITTGTGDSTTTVIAKGVTTQSALSTLVGLIDSENTRINTIDSTIGTAKDGDVAATGMFALIQANSDSIANLQAATTGLKTGTNKQVTVSVSTDETTGAKEYTVSGTDALDTAVTKVGTGDYATTVNYISNSDTLTTAVGKLDTQVKENTDDIAAIGYSVSGETLTLYLTEKTTSAS